MVSIKSSGYFILLVILGFKFERCSALLERRLKMSDKPQYAYSIKLAQRYRCEDLT
ncbi:hypothetical protein J2T03_003147 [Chryseobacterium lathyri]|nr:hypothetical protein [Chryseobacterium lathyri]